MKAVHLRRQAATPRPGRTTPLPPRPWGRMVLLAGLLLTASATMVAAQSAVMNITGIVSPLNPPLVKNLPLLGDQFGGASFGAFNFTYTGTEAAELTFLLTVEVNGEAIVDEEESEPETFEPNQTYIYTSLSQGRPSIRFSNLSYDKVVGMMPGNVRLHVANTGMLPEGEYTVILVALQDGDEIGQGLVSFSVVYPDPPSLIAPDDEELVELPLVSFSWLNVTIPGGGGFPQYDFKLVEVKPGQPIVDAYNNNPAHHTQAGLNTTTLVYTPDLPPLQSGQTYAWAVQVRSDQIPFVNEGLSEIYTFTYAQVVDLASAFTVISPADGTEVSGNVPMAWQLAGLPGQGLQYQVFIRDQQTGAQANQPDWISEPNYTFRPDPMPTADQAYEWSVRVRSTGEETVKFRDASGEEVDEGTTEQFMFRYKLTAPPVTDATPPVTDPPVTEDPPAPVDSTATPPDPPVTEDPPPPPVTETPQPTTLDAQTLDLIPGFATLNGIQNLAPQTLPDGFLLNGTTTLSLQTVPPQEISINVDNLKLKRTDPDNPEWVSGSVLATGLNVRLGSAPLELRLNALSSNIPGDGSAALIGTGELLIDGGKGRCALPTLNIDSGGFEISNCATTQPMRMEMGQVKVSLNLSNASGTLFADAGGLGGFLETDVAASVIVTGQPAPAEIDGKLELSNTGFAGTLTAQNLDLKLGAAPMEAHINSLTARFATEGGTVPEVEGSGTVVFFGDAAKACPIQSFSLSGAAASLTMGLCELDQTISLLKGQEKDLVWLNLRQIEASTLGFDGTLSFDVAIEGAMHVAVEGSSCGVAFNGAKLSNAGFDVGQVQPMACGVSLPRLNLGFSWLQLQNLTLPKLTFGPLGWDFELAFNPIIEIPSLDNFKQALVDGLARIAPNGITIPPFDFNSTDTGPLWSFQRGPLQVALTRVQTGGLRIDWANLDLSTLTQWQGLTLGVTLALPPDKALALPGAERAPPPACLSEGIPGTLNLSGTGLRAEATRTFDDAACSFVMGSGGHQAVFSVQQFKAALRATYENGEVNFEPPSATMGGRLALGAPFECPEQAAAPIGGETTLTLDARGRLSGTLTNVAQGCTLPVGSYAASLSNDELTLGLDGDTPTAQFKGTASLNIGGGAPGSTAGGTLSGSIDVDVAAGTINDYSLTGTNIAWAIPKANPVFNFRLALATLTKEGLAISGANNTMDLGSGQSLNVGFTDVKVNLAEMKIDAGAITFGGQFALDVDLNNLHAPTYKAVSYNTTAPAQHVLLKLSGGVTLDRDGLKMATTTQVQADLNYQTDQLNLTNQYNVQFAKDEGGREFAFRFSPFGIQSGRVEVVNATGIRYFWGDQTGFYPDGGLLPTTLPLPSAKVAYLVLRDDDPAGTPKVEFDRQADGNFLLYTKPGQQVQLRLPGLNDATLNITITREQALTFQPKAPFLITSGEVLVENLAQLAIPDNFPIIPKSLRFGWIEDQARFILTGTLKELKLPNTTLSDACSVALGSEQADGAWQLKGDVDCVLDGIEPLALAGQRVRLGLSKATGHVVVPLETGAAPEVAATIDGQFHLHPADAGEPVTTDVRLTLDGSGTFNAGFVSTEGTDARPEFVVFEKGGIKLTLTKFTPHTLAYQNETFAFAMDLGLKAQYTTKNEKVYNVPGFDFGVSNAGLKYKGRSEPGTGEKQFKAIGPVAVKLLDVKMPEGAKDKVLNIFAGDVSFNDVLAVLPSTFSMDIKLSDTLAQKYPDLAGDVLHLDQMGYNPESRVFAGTVESVLHRPYRINIDQKGEKGLDIERFVLGFSENEDSSQGVEFDLFGRAVPAQLACQGQGAPTFEAKLGTEGLRGTIAGVCFGTPPDAAGNLTYSLTGGQLDFAYGGEQNAFNLKGTASATLKLSETNQAQASGTLGIDLLTGHFFESDLKFGPFTMGYPVANPTFNFAIAEATLDGPNLVVTGQGNLNLGDQGAAVTVAFDNAKFGLDAFGLQDGAITVNAPLAFNIPIGGTTPWTLVRANEDPLPATGPNLFQLGLATSLTLTPAGISLTGTAGAKLRHARLDETWAARLQSASLAFTDFQLTFDNGPHVSAGVAALSTDNQQVATYDSDGLHLNIPGLAVAVTKEMLPGILALPDSNAAYLVLREGGLKSGALLIEPTIDTQAETIQLKTTSALDVVFPKFTDAQGTQARAQATFDLTLNYNDLSKVLAINQVSVSTNEALSQALFGTLPVSVDSLALEMPANESVRVTAGVTLNLPDAITKEAFRTRFQFGSNGIEQLDFSAGNTDCGAAQFEAVNLPANKGTVKVCHVQFAFVGTTPTSFAVKGNLKSEYLKRKDANEPLSIDFSGGYTNDAWTFALDRIDQPSADETTAPKPKSINLKVGTFTLAPENGLSFTTNDGFAVKLNGRLEVDAFGKKKDGYTPPAFTVQDLQIGTKGVCGSVALEQQAFGMFDNKLNVTVNKLALDLPGATSADGATTCSAPDQLAFLMEGDMNLLEKGTFAFSGFRIGLDGTIALGTAEYTLAEGKEITIIPDVFKFNKVALSFENDFLPKLTATGPLELPKPFTVAGDGTAGLSLSVDAEGSVNIAPQWPDISVAQKIEFKVGTKDASLALTSFKPDIAWDNLDEAKIKLAAEFRVGNQMVQFGDPEDMAQKWGILLQTSQLPQWQITRSEVDLNFEAGLFGLHLTEVRTPENAAGFAVALGGTAKMRVGGVSGSVKVSGFTIALQDNLPAITAFGDYSNFDLKVLNKFQLTVGEFDRCAENNCQFTKTQKSGGTANDPQTAAAPFSVDRYIKFTNGSLALASFDGKVEEVSFFQKGSDFGLYINGFDMRMKKGEETLVELEAHLELEENNGFLLRAAGAGTFKGKVKDVGIAFAGKISTRNNELSFGLFATVTTTVPLIPGVLDVKAAGLGFFYKPEQADLDLVLKTINITLPGPKEAQPQMDGLDFSVLFYGDFGLVGSEGNYSAEVKALLDFGVGSGRMEGGFQAVGSVFKQPDNFKFSAYLRIRDQGSRFMLMGGAAVDVNYASVVEGKGELNFQVIDVSGQTTKWAINGNMNFTFVKIIEAQAKFAASNTSFLLQISQRISKDLAIIEFSAGFEISLWWIQNKSFGAYFIADASLEVLFGAASASGMVKGAFLKEGPNWLLYGAANVSFKILLVSASLDVWIAIENGGWDGGTGRDETYWKRVQAASATADKMEEEMKAVQNQIEAALTAPLAYTKEDLKKGADGLISMGRYERAQLFEKLVRDEEKFLAEAQNWWTGPFDRYRDWRTEILQTLDEALVIAEPTSFKERDVLNAELEALNEKLEDLQTRYSAIKNYLETVQPLSLSFAAGGACPFDAGLLDAGNNCLLKAETFAWQSDQQAPLAQVDFDALNNKNQALVDALNTFRTEGDGNVELQNESSLAAIKEMVTNINQIAVNLDGRGLLTPPPSVGYTVPGTKPEPLSQVTRQYMKFLEDVNRYYAAHLKSLDWFAATRGGATVIEKDGNRLNDALKALVGPRYRPQTSGDALCKRIVPIRKKSCSWLGCWFSSSSRVTGYRCDEWNTPSDIIKPENEPLLAAALELAGSRTFWIEILRSRGGAPICKDYCKTYENVATLFQQCTATCDEKGFSAAQSNYIAQDKMNNQLATLGKLYTDGRANMQVVRDTLRSFLDQTGRAMWRDIPAFAVEELVPAMQLQSTSIRNDYFKNREVVTTGYRQLSTAIDKVYGTRKQMLLDLYQVVEAYARFQSHSADDLPEGKQDSFETWQAFQAEIAKQLEPPVVTRIQARTGITPGFTWQVDPEGSAVGEYAYRMSLYEWEDGASKVTYATDGYLSVGHAGAYLEPLVTKNYMTKDTQVVTATMRLRARSTGGVVSYSDQVQADWDLKLNLNNQAAPPATPRDNTTSAQADGDLLPEDTTPPRITRLEPPKPLANDIGQTGTGHWVPVPTADTDTRYALAEQDLSKHVPAQYSTALSLLPKWTKYWTNATSALDLTVRAQSGKAPITTLEYNFNTMKGVFENAFNLNLSWLPIGSPQTGTLTRISLDEAKLQNLVPGGLLENKETYGLTVQVQNNRGNMEQRMLIYEVDQTGPVLELDARSRSATLNPTPIATLLLLDNADTPELIHPTGSQTSAGRPLPLSWKMSDEGSGIAQVFYAYSDSADPAEITARQVLKHQDMSTQTLTPFVGTLWKPKKYIHVWAVDKVGNLSNVLTRPFWGPARPAHPLVQAQRAPGGVNLFWVRLTRSEIKGYQYSIGTAPGKTDIRGWNNSSVGSQEVDFTIDLKNLSTLPPHLFIPLSDVSPDQHQQGLYINVIALNPDNVPSRVVSTGPITPNYYRTGTR